MSKRFNSLAYYGNTLSIQYITINLEGFYMIKIGKKFFPIKPPSDSIELGKILMRLEK